MLSSTVAVDRLAKARAKNATGSQMNRSKVTNGKKMLAGLDGRSAEARRWRDLVASYTSDLGGPAKLTEAQRTLVTQAATLQVQAERMQAAVIRGEPVDAEQLTRLANAATRCLARLGMRAAPDKPPVLSAYLGRIA
jgi:hypothetical protein